MDFTQLTLVASLMEKYPIVAIITFLIATANFITVVAPSVTKNKFYNIAMKGLNWMAFNFGKNKNADDKPVDQVK